MRCVVGKYWIIIEIFSLFFYTVLLSPVYAQNDIVLNEFLPHPQGSNKEWIEIYNPEHIDITGYWIDDDTSFMEDTGTSPKKNLATLISADSKYPYIELTSFLNNSGDFVVLYSDEGVIIDQYQYNSDPGIDISVGRSLDGLGIWTQMAITTKGQPNILPTPTPLYTPTITPEATPTILPSPTSSIPVTVTPTISAIPSIVASITPTPYPSQYISSQWLRKIFRNLWQKFPRFPL